jgi:hypothetical protein
MLENSIYFRNSTPEQRVLIQYVENLPGYTSLVPLYFKGAIAATEFLTYAVTKVYLCLIGRFGQSAVAGNAGTITLYNTGDAVSMIIANNAPYWDGAAIQVIKNTFEIKNTCFSRIVNVQYTYMEFIGYRVTL